MSTVILNPSPSTRPTRIKVFLVDDSPLALAVLKKILSSSPDIEVIGTAANGKEAMRLIPQLQPNVICTDFHMPVMDGLQLTREVMRQHPLPILVISISVENDSPRIFELLEAGAVDVFPKPKAGLDGFSPQLAGNLIRKIKILAGVRVVRKFSSGKSVPPLPPSDQQKQLPFPTWGRSIRLIVIGASTGGPQTLQAILAKLPADFPVPVICIQHIAEGFLDGLLKWLAPQCKMRMMLAEVGKIPQPGTIYLAPESCHLRFDRHGGFLKSQDPPVKGHRPSITVTMVSAVEAYGNAVTGILLTGMGDDGAKGMLAISEAGGITIAQDEATSAVFGMPKQAIEMGAVQYVMSPDNIVDTLNKAFRRNGNGSTRSRP